MKGAGFSVFARDLQKFRPCEASDGSTIPILHAPFHWPPPCGFVMASELRACGVDLSFGPLSDLDYGQSKVIGNRSFHRNPKVVATLSMALISGMAQIGLANCGKHFPGHGYVSEDSHLELPEDPRDLAALRSNDEVPYQILGPLLTSVMPAHVVYSEVDSTPAGFSAKWIQEELRGRLKI